MGIGVAIAVVAAVWSASGGVGYLLSAVNLAYDEDETRGFIRRKLLALGMTLGAIIFVLLAIALFTAGAAIGDHVAPPVRILLVVVLMLWLWLTAYAVLLGAEINAEAEQQTARDTTRGEPRPLGRRNAVKADSIPE
ncbi:YihY/virulence factor BrkB family protein [Kribbella soli]